MERVLARIRSDGPLAFFDVLVVVVSFMTLLFIRFNGSIPDTYTERLYSFLPVIVAAHLVANWAWSNYGQIWAHASIAEARRVFLAGATAGAFIFVVNPMNDLSVPRSVAVVGALGSAVLMTVVRFQVRLLGSRKQADRTATRVVVVGAGDAGAAILREMQRRPDNGRTPVVVVDDDPRKQGRNLLGTPVVGSIATLDAVVAEHRAEEVLVAMPSADQDLLRSIIHGAELAAVPVKVLPPVRDLLGNAPTVRDARDVRIEDLLGRTQVATDIDSIRATVQGKVVVITGAGGSIGSEISRQVADCQPGRLLLLDHDETHLHDARGIIHGPNELVLADIRDRERMIELFAEVKPDVVFHAAAHKHVPLLEQHPSEAIRTNVLGTRNVVDAAVNANVGRLVFISSDKAVRPSNNLGYSKWLGEQLVLHAMPPGTRWCSVRFGNVLGSRGSVIPTFARQIAEGGPLTVTDPRMTRYFMSVQEAVQLVLQASTLSDGGEIFMLDMGQPVNILELAERMVRLSGHQVGTEIPIHFTGIREGEKLAEDLQNPEETASPTAHPSILRLTPTAVPVSMLDDGTRGLADLVVQRADHHAAQRMAALAEAGHNTHHFEFDAVELSERRNRWSPSTT
ncbi:MAG TPA: nucleoside-diphosphate sugar epimerase/dehydratase [Acidimicrobiales bacterium]|nr:nucleoside-diphosphate sugar epimerase/dehydratase [Acidimicrobiales bacterium]